MRNPAVNHFKSPEEDGKIPSDISQPQGNSDNAEVTDNLDVDEDSKDVLVGSIPLIGDVIQEHISEFCSQQESAGILCLMLYFKTIFLPAHVYSLSLSFFIFYFLDLPGDDNITSGNELVQIFYLK